MAISSIAIRRFKSLDNLEMSPGDTTLLIGANNSGKSSVLQAIHFAVSIAQTSKMIGENLAWAQDKFELSFSPAQLIYTPVADVMALSTGAPLREAREGQIEIELRTAAGDRCVVGLRRGRNRNVAVSIEGRILGSSLQDISNPFSVYAPGLAGIPKEERYMSPGVVRRIVARGDANLVLRNVLLMLSKDETAWAAFLDDMRKLFPEIEVHIDFDERVDENIEVTFQFPTVPKLPLDAAGTSILQASQIFGYIALFKPKLLILDEPDSHLHPNNQRALCSLIHKSTAERGFQALISTHSRHVLDALKDDTVVVWLSKGSVVKDVDNSTTALLLDIGALDSIDYFADAALRCVVATEDDNMEPLKALLWSSGFHEDQTEVVSYQGCSKQEAALVLGAFLRDKAPHTKIVVHRDRDYSSEEFTRRYAETLENASILPFLTAQNDIESYFVNAAHLSQLNAGLNMERANELIQQATNDTRDESIRSIVNQRTQEAFVARRRGGNQPDHGQIAINASRDYDNDSATMRRGKVVLARLVTLLQQEIGAHPRVFEPTMHLRAPELTHLASQVWE